MLSARGIDLVLLKSTEKDNSFTTEETPGSTLYQRLLAGKNPPWLRPVPLTEKLAQSYAIFEVIE